MSKKDEDKCDCEEEKITTTKKQDIMKQSIYDKKVELPKEKGLKEQSKSKADEEKVKAMVSKCGNIQPFKLEDMDVEKVLVEYRIRKPSDKSSKNDTKKVEKGIKESAKISDCDAFRLAGFQQDWTKEKVENMLKSDDGRAILERVDREFKKLTGKKSISESDILKCYPNYLKKSKNIQLSIKIDE